MAALRAPFPWFWLLNRPHEPRVETVNDKDAYLCNFWRAVQADPDAVAYYADWPVSEPDLHARHRWLVTTARKRLRKVLANPEHYDAKVAGWWVYGLCLWIGSGWCASNREQNTRNEYPPGQRKRPVLVRDGQRGVIIPPRKMPQTDRGGRGIAGPSIEREFGAVHANGSDADRILEWDVRPDLTAANGRGGVMVAQKRPHLAGNGQGVGVHRVTVTPHGRRPNMGGAGGGQGVHAPTVTRTSRKKPYLADSGGRGVTKSELDSPGLYAYMRELQIRLRRVRVCCGDWTRVLTPAVTTYIGLTGVLLDPPYDQSRRAICYSHDNDISQAVREWALTHGADQKLRIALCGYEGEHEMPSSWECLAWKAGGGYGRTERGKANRDAERIWFSPHCLRPSSGLPFSVDVDEAASLSLEIP